MANVRDIIVAEEETFRRLHNAIHETFAVRGQSETTMQAWRDACRVFHAYVSPLDHLLERLNRAGGSRDPELKDFAITYLELDPTYFRSGYIKENLLQRLKSCDLNDADVTRLTAVMLDAVRHRGQREFRRYCRLAAKLHRPDMVVELGHLSESPDRHVSSRARLMLQYVRYSRDSDNQPS